MVFVITSSRRQSGIVLKIRTIFETQTLHHLDTVWVQVAIWKHSRSFVAESIEQDIGHIHAEVKRFPVGCVASLRRIKMVLDQRIEKRDQSGEAD